MQNRKHLLLLSLIITVFCSKSLSAANIIWSGTNGTIWDTNSTINGSNEGVPSRFLTSDSVTFDDTAANGNVMISGTVQPASVIFNSNSLAYTLGGSGRIAGTTSLLKSGIDTLTITNTNKRRES